MARRSTSSYAILVFILLIVLYYYTKPSSGPIRERNVVQQAPIVTAPASIKGAPIPRPHHDDPIDARIVIKEQSARIVKLPKPRPPLAAIPLPPVKLLPQVEKSDKALERASTGDIEPDGDNEQSDLANEAIEDSIVPLRKPIIDAPINIPPAKPRVEPKKQMGAGWSQRFASKQKAGTDSDEAPIVVVPASGLLAHPLVARLANYDFTVLGLAAAPIPIIPTASTLPSDDDDHFQAQPVAAVVPTILKVAVYKPPKRVNMTICALIPAEQRFLPEWLLYHRLMGVERFALYDTSVAGAAGAAEVDGYADAIASGKGDIGPSAEEIKLGLGSGSSGLDDKGKIWAERIVGLEKWVNQGVVVLHYMKFHDLKSAQGFHEQMIRHCENTFSENSNWLAHLDVDEFLIESPTLYGPTEPYQSSTFAPATPADPWTYPLHDLLARAVHNDSACIPIPQLKYRNVGIRTLTEAQGVLQTQIVRDVVSDGIMPEKALIHPAFSRDFVKFAGPHSCQVMPNSVPEGLSKEIKNSQGVTLQVGGIYESQRVPTEPLAIAHYLQRDLSDCHQKLANLNDPNSLRTENIGKRICNENYLPSPAEANLPSFSAQNQFLASMPPAGSVIEDRRVADSWTAKATRKILDNWITQRGKNIVSKGVAGAGGEVDKAREKVVMLSF